MSESRTFYQHHEQALSSRHTLDYRSRLRALSTIIHSLLLYVLLTLFALLTLFPILWMLLASFKSPTELSAIPPTILPQVWRWQNFFEAWQSAPFSRYLLNSFFIACAIMVLETATSALAAYAFARLHFPGRDIIFLAYLGTLMIPQQVTLVPRFIIMRDLGWIDSYQGLILPQVFSAFGTFLLRQFFLTIPFELEDAARIDGASRFKVFTTIILPLSTPAIATLAIFIFFYQWNNLLWPLVISNTIDTRPVAVGLRFFLGEYANEWHLLMAASTLATIPPIILYIFTQRWFVRGITLTGFGGR
jgi:multiple sugar transport system permease protein